MPKYLVIELILVENLDFERPELLSIEILKQAILFSAAIIKLIS